MVRLLTSGWYTSIQDAGRYGYRSLGVPLSGAMDQGAMRLANSLVGNTDNTAVVECTLQGPTLEFDCDAAIVITGALSNPTLNGDHIGINKVWYIKKGDIVSLGMAKNGVFGYVAVEGGWDSNEVLGSASQYVGISPKAHLKKKDVLCIADSTTKKHHRLDTPTHTFLSSNASLEVYPGPEFQRLTESQQKKLIETNFSIGKGSNRMAYYLKHKASYSAPEIITSPVQPGTVQLTPSGDIMVLMRDAQTTGGYSRILQLTDESIDVLSQKRVGDHIPLKLLT